MKVLRLLHAAGLSLPGYATAGAVGLDLAAAIEVPFAVTAGKVVKIPTGFAVEIPPGYEGQVRMRSGYSTRNGIMIPNAPGTIDPDYRGEIMISLIHFNRTPVLIEPGDRIAQLIIAPVARVEIEEVSELSETERGTGGFGSTGK
jgi:dUTP pyrophosphatase